MVESQALRFMRGLLGRHTRAKKLGQDTQIHSKQVRK